jgi:hypothetical protein
MIEKHIQQVILLVILVSIGSRLGYGAALAAGRTAPLLPADFAGWHKTSSQTSSDPSVADPVSAGALREFGFSDFERASYGRDGREMKVQAARFADASGAYGAFTYYKVPAMLTEKIGELGASFNSRILFYRGNILVEATLDRTTAMSAAELRELSDTLPVVSGPAGNSPTLPQYLPKQAYVKNSAKYALGPLALQSAGTPIPAEQVEFARGAEVAEGKYSSSRGTATLMIIAYPTPQIAGERLRALAALGESAASPSDPSLAPPFITKRTGPMVVLVAGQISTPEAKSLLASVNYDADVTWNQNTYLDKKNNVANFLVNVIFLVFIIIAFALVAGLAFGGVRILLKKALPGKIFDRAQDMEIIQLNIRGGGRG